MKDEDFIFINHTSSSISSTPKLIPKKACLTSYFLAVKHTWERPPSVAETLLDTGLDNSTDAYVM